MPHNQSPPQSQRQSYLANEQEATNYDSISHSNSVRVREGEGDSHESYSQLNHNHSELDRYFDSAAFQQQPQHLFDGQNSYVDIAVPFKTLDSKSSSSSTQQLPQLLHLTFDYSAKPVNYNE